jgi:hypothetical protein
MPRRNRNAGAIRLDTDQLAADLAHLAADLCPRFLTGRGKSTLLVRCLARTVTPGPAVVVTGGTQHIPHFAPESR